MISFLLSRHSRIHILNELMNSVKRYWRFYFSVLLDISCVKPNRYFNLFVRVVESDVQMLVLWLRTWRLIRSRRSILRLFYDSSREPRLRKSRFNLSLSKRSHSKSNCGRNHAQSHFDLQKSHDLQLRLSHQKIFPLLHQDALDLLAHRRQIWATMLRLKALFLRVCTNDHQNFVWLMSDIFENWRGMVFQC